MTTPELPKEPVGTGSETLLEFPCDFPLKIMGAAREDFAQTIVAVVLRHAPALVGQHHPPGADGGQQGHWGNQNDAVTWKDDRWDKAQHGPVFSGVFRGAGLTIPKGVCVQGGAGGRLLRSDDVVLPCPMEG